MNRKDRFRFTKSSVLLLGALLFIAVVISFSCDQKTDETMIPTEEVKEATIPQTETSVPGKPQPYFPMFRGNPAHTGAYDEAGPKTSPELLWKFKVPAVILGSPTIADGIVYVGSFDMHVYAIDAATGVEKWRFKTGNWVESSPAVADGIVYVGSNDNHLYALDSATGIERWRFKTGGFVVSSPTVEGGVVYIGGGDGNIYALDSVTGREKWRFGGLENGFATVSVADDTVYVCDEEVGLYALDAVTGEKKWFIDGYFNELTSMAVLDGVVFKEAGWYIIAIDAATGKEKWRFKGEAEKKSKPPAVTHGVVYATYTDSYVYALDAVTGIEIWHTRIPGRRKYIYDFNPTSPTVADGIIYVGSVGIENNNLYALDALTGVEKWNFRAAERIDYAPTVVDGVVYFSDMAGYLYALH
ncbi:MAG: PQQ-binding-like beta-propeller repeat protein [Deltaproteobacteria bacterium]|nr:PQQ-binding-like beta-propeller repeat protein [Candidatus Zymogenaceae bacterium]